MKVEVFTVGPLATNCYLVFCPKTKEAVIIDPGFGTESEAKKFLKKVFEKGLKLKFILNTHGHPDHTSGNGVLKRETGAPILIHRLDLLKLGPARRQIYEMFGFKIWSPPADMLLKEGDTVKFGEVSLKVLHTPGHSRGSISLIGENCIFCGDTLFAGSIGRYDFPDSSFEELMTSLTDKLMILPEDFIVYPGHGPLTTIGREKRTNPFLKGIFRGFL